MGIFNRTKATAPKAADDKKPKKAAAKKVESSEVTSSVVKTATTVSGNSARVLLSPRVSEKSAILASKGTYVFNVPISANKIEVRKAVESMYKVGVESVHMVRGIGKAVTRGRMSGTRKDWKKALVTLKKGQKIDLYAGV